MVAVITWFAWLLCLMTGLMLLWADRESELQWISPLRWFGIAFFVLHLIMPFNILYFKETLDLKFDSSDYFLMCVASVIGGISFWFGWRLKRCIAEGPIIIPEKHTGLNNRRFIQVLLLFPISVMALIALSHAYGSLFAFAVVPFEASDLIGQDFYNIFSFILASFIPLTILALVQFHNTRYVQRIWWAIAGTLLFLIYFLISMKLGSRFRLLFIILPVFAMYCSTRNTRVNFRPMLLLGCCGIIFYVLGRIRHHLVLLPGDFLDKITGYFSESSSSLYFDIFMSGDFDAFQNGMHLLSVVPYSKPLMWGSTFFSVVYNPIPRFIWPGKPSPTINQYLIDQELGPASVGHYNFAVSLIAELYANYWWIGVILGMFLFGIIAAYMWNWFLSNRHRHEAWFHIALFCAYMLVVTRGSFHSMTVYYLMIAITEIMTRKIARTAAPLTKTPILHKDDKMSEDRCQY